MLNKSAVKYIQSLQHKKFRDEYHAFVAEGPKVVKELMHSGVYSCELLCAVQEWIITHEDFLSQFPLEQLIEVAPHELSKISTYATPNQVMAVFKQRQMQVLPDTHQGITLVLDRIQDPGNLGTIIRTADWFGIRQIVCSIDSADIYNHKVVQSTMASMAHVDVHYTDLAAWLNKQKEVPVYAMMLEGESLDTIRITAPAIIIIGNEANGIADNLLPAEVRKITITGYGKAESLNAAVAAAIVMFKTTGA